MCFLQILFPVHQENAAQPGGDGHWFTFVVNMQDKKFQVIDSLRNPDNVELKLKANQVCAKVITLWNRYTAKVDGCNVCTIYNFELPFIGGTSNWDVSTSRSYLYPKMNFKLLLF